MLNGHDGRHGRPEWPVGPVVAGRLDDDTYETVRRLAERQHRKISDVVRDAINRYLEAS